MSKTTIFGPGGVEIEPTTNAVMLYTRHTVEDQPLMGLLKFNMSAEALSFIRGAREAVLGSCLDRGERAIGLNNAGVLPGVRFVLENDGGAFQDEDTDFYEADLYVVVVCDSRGDIEFEISVDIDRQEYRFRTDTIASRKFEAMLHSQALSDDDLIEPDIPYTPGEYFRDEALELHGAMEPDFGPGDKAV